MGSRIQWPKGYWHLGILSNAVVDLIAHSLGSVDVEAETAPRVFQNPQVERVELLEFPS